MQWLPLQELREALVLGRVESTVILYMSGQELTRVDLNIHILYAHLTIAFTNLSCV